MVAKTEPGTLYLLTKTESLFAGEYNTNSMYVHLKRAEKHTQPKQSPTLFIC